MRLAQKIVAVLSIFAAFALFAVPASSAEVTENGEGHVCVSIDGVVKVQKGTATCFSTLGNKAVANGAGSFASANGGMGSRAHATGGGEAITFLADSSVARASGADSVASVSFGADNLATSIDGGSAQVVFCTGETISAVAGETNFLLCDFAS